MRTTTLHSSPAIVLKWRAYGESDKIVTFLTRDFGKLSGIAKGALRSRRRFVNALEPFTHVQLGFRARASADLSFIESADIVRPARTLSRDLDRYAYSTYVLELIDCMVEGREADAALFELTDEVLWRIDTDPAAPSSDWLRYFETRLLALTGFEPRMDACGRCRRRSAEAPAPFRFNPRDGKLLCGDCADQSGMVVSQPAVRAILGLRSAALGKGPSIETSAATEVRVILQTFIAHHARRPLKSPALLREILGL